MKKRVNSRRKGNQAERDVIKILKKYFGGHWERKSMGIPGPDILAPEDFPFVIEVKNDKTVKAIHLLAKPDNQKLMRYWTQAVGQAQNTGKTALLVIKVEGHWFASTTWRDFLPLNQWCEIEAKRENQIPVDRVLQKELSQPLAGNSYMVLGTNNQQNLEL
jgi:hypothetical protein